MNKIIHAIFIALIITPLYALNATLIPIEVDTSNKEALQRGAQLYMNYCSGCHSLRYMRYSRMAKDLGLTTFDGQIDNELLHNNLVFTQVKIQDPIEISIPEVDARQWFGRVPPDLSLTARERSPSWIYTYLKSFYADPKRPFHANNLLVPDVAMPNILAPLGGIVAIQNRQTETPSLVLIENGEMTAQQFDHAVRDLVTFLTYVAEPVKSTRISIGLKVLPFLSLLLIVVYLLKRTYWKKVDKR